MTVSLVEILAAARAHVAPLAAESAGYLLLGIADHVSLTPRVVLPEDVELLPDGAVRLRVRASSSADAAEIERSLRLLLGRTLEVASAAGPALRRAAQRADGSGLLALVRELENALIPVNRAAAKRALSRVHRETERALASGKLQSWLAAASSEPVPAIAVAPSEPAPAVAVAADFPDASPAALPAVAAVVASPAPSHDLALLTSEPAGAPLLAEATPLPFGERELELTKPEPFVLRSRQRAQRTPQLGTLLSALGPEGSEPERTERAPLVDELVELSDDDFVDERVAAPDVTALELPAKPWTAAETTESDPEPSVLPDVLLAMVELHAGVSPDEAPTRLRDVVTEVASPGVASWPAPLPSVPSPLPAEVETDWLIQSSVAGTEVGQVVSAGPRGSSSEPQAATFLFESESADPALHEATTWDPGPVMDRRASVAASLLVAAPVELSPLVPAVLPVRSSQVSELVESFYVSGAAEEHELRAALAELAAGQTPTPRRYGESS